MLLIRMRGRKYRLNERVLDPKRGFCPLFYVSTLDISGDGEFNHAPIDYLQGNPIKPDRLNVPPHGKNLFDYAPSLYRLLLTAFLGLNYYDHLSPENLAHPPTTQPECLSIASTASMVITSRRLPTF